MSNAVTKPPLPERNGSVYNDTIVDHMPAIIRRTGIRSVAAANATVAGCCPDMEVSTMFCQTGIQRSGAAKTITGPRHSAGKRSMID